jgi:hypothetical protein
LVMSQRFIQLREHVSVRRASVVRSVVFLKPVVSFLHKS